MEKELSIYQEEGSSSVTEDTGGCPIREKKKPIVEVGTVAKEKYYEPEQLKSFAEKKKTAYTSEDSSIGGALVGSISANFFLKNDSIKVLREDVLSPRASLSHNDYKALVQDKFYLGKESHDALEAGWS
ncbi:unnamed protein product [Lepeophtheirus salmonis]|uniref:(salmon louse) hypothetical protein n=1 Tax=Lepeophtheirus salmonis TaxID=72036 RepID=A0A7R8H653_LEPSM|nr:unnamed protein product [Lepeophtheirus salmonis]CAF2875133.1 unnamed protein product [Lepeophtheirus salmonis]